MVLIMYCDRCDAAIKIKPSPFTDLYCQMHKIRRSWVAISEALGAHGWTFTDEGAALCPKHSGRDVLNVKPRSREYKRFQEDQASIPSTPGVTFTVEIPARELSRFKLAVFFVSQNMQETTGFLLRQFADYVLSGNLREKSETAYYKFLDERDERREENVKTEMQGRYERAAAGFIAATRAGSGNDKVH